MSQSLVTVDQYRTITADTTTDACAVTARLEDSIALIEEYLQRNLESATYTETLEVWYEDGAAYVYPINTPITAIPVDSSYEIDYGDRRLRNIVTDVITGTAFVGFGGLGRYEGALSPYARSRPDYATVEYTGGFTTATLPVTIRQYIALGAYGLAKRTAATVVGAQEMTVGDISVKFPTITGALDALVPGLTLGLKSYKRKRIRF